VTVVRVAVVRDGLNNQIILFQTICDWLFATNWQGYLTVRVP